MDDRTEARILDKATYVRDAVTVLADKRDSLSYEAYRGDREQRDIVEREFETAIEACIDIGELLLRADGADVPETNASVFRELGDRGVLADDLAERMAQAAGFRNVLSHQYGAEIDDEDVFNFLQHELPLFRTYLTAVRDELD
jgi:uncharacterized protein YutE (UPF0331/DUF86 family)